MINKENSSHQKKENQQPLKKAVDFLKFFDHRLRSELKKRK